MTKIIRTLLWRLLGFDYQMLLNKTDYVLLKNDAYTHIGISTYDNGAKVWRWTNAQLNIGNYCSIAYDVNFIVDEGFHKGSSIANYPLINNLNKERYSNIIINERQGITIGHDVWIGMGAFIMPGIKIGNGAIIAANSVVTKDIPDYAIVAGSPAIPVKMKFDINTINQLNDIAWWNWDEEKVQECIFDFYQPVDMFMNKYLK
jgi:virginiamycin A acetyltransferase